MANSIVTYTGDGVTTQFSIPFPYISPNDVKVFVNGNEMLRPWNWRFLNPSTVELNFTPGEGDKIVVKRMTEEDKRLVTYENGAILTEEELNLAFLQNFYLIQEMKDGLVWATEGSLGNITPELVDDVLREILSDEIAQELQQRITDIDSLGQELIDTNIKLDAVMDNVGDGALAAITERIEILEGADEAFALSLLGITSRVDNTEDGIADLQADLLLEQSTRASQDEAIALQILDLSAKVDNNEDGIADVVAALEIEQQTRASEDEALALLLSALGSRVDDAEAAIVDEQLARAGEDEALALSITALQTTVGEHTSTITSLAESVNGISARYGVALNVNGYITGFEQFNDGNSGTFSILADKFYIVDPANNGQNPKAVFAVTGGVVYMQNVVIQDAVIQSLTVGKLTTGTLNADINVGTGRIVWTNGTYMKVAGVGFGTSNQFIEWYGPAMNINQCSEANAIMYLKTNGDAYYGGSLSAGVLTTAGQTSNTASNASIEIGPFGSNGGTIKVAHSYTFGCTALVNTPMTVSLRLRRKIGTGSYSTVATYSNVPADIYLTNPGDPFNPPIYQYSISASYTYTDNAMSTSDRTYLWEITSRGDPVGATSLVQNLSIVSTEE